MRALYGQFPTLVITANPMTPQERRSVAALSLLYMIRMLGLFMVLPLLALYAADLPDATPFLIGLTLGIYGLTQALLQIPLGWLSDRVGRKPVIIGGLLVFGLGSVIAALADTVTGIVIGRALQGAGAIASTVMALVADVTSDEQRTKAMAIVGISIGAAFALALVIGPAVAGVGGLPAVFWLTAVLALAGIALVLLRVPAAPSPTPRAESGVRLAEVGESLRNGELRRLNIGIFTLHFVLTASFLVVPGLLETTGGVDRAAHWQVYLPALGLSVLGMWPLLSLGERGGRPRAAFVIAVGTMVFGLLGMGLVSEALLLYAALWLFFTGFNFFEATLPSMVSKAAPAAGRGTALGAFSTSQFLGIFSGGAVGGWLFQWGGAGAVIVCCLLLCLLWTAQVLRAPVVGLGGGEPANRAGA